jgi:hypothetical protein
LLAVVAVVFSAPRLLAEEVQPSEDKPLPTQAADGPKPELIKLEPKLDLDPVDQRQQSESGPPGQSVTLFGGVVEKNLAIEWDKWHNRLVHAVPPRVFNNVIEALDVPTGATTGIHCEVTSDRHIKTVQVVKSSGNLWFDKLVRDAVYKLDGHYILTFPPNSKRTEVATNFSITKGGKDRGDLMLGDIEYAELTPDQSAALEQAQQSTPGQRSSKRRTGKKVRTVESP